MTDKQFDKLIQTIEEKSTKLYVGLIGIMVLIVLTGFFLLLD